MRDDDVAADFAARAEQHRLDGDALAALRLAEAGLAEAPGDLRGRIALALARIDLGDVLHAREELAAVLRPAAPEPAPVDLAAVPAPSTSDGLGEDLQDDELETAFAQAESDPEEMMDANRVVEQTLRAAELDTPEPDFDLASNPTYATETMAALLDGQGRRNEAEALRESLATDPESSMEPMGGEGDEGARAGFLGPEHAQRLRVVATLEGWLHNLHQNAEHDARTRAGGRAGGAV